MEDVSRLSEALGCSELFRGISPSALKSSFILSFRRGEAVSETQNGIDCVGVVISGSLTVSAGAGSSVSVMKKGGEFGICNIFVREKMPTDLRARVRAEVLFMPKEDFARLLAADSGLMYRYVRLCNEKMLYLAERLSLLSATDCTERLWLYLKMTAEDGSVNLAASKDEIARRIGISRSSLFRAIKSLTDSGRIAVSPGGKVALLRG